MDSVEDERSSFGWFLAGARGIFSLPAMILMLSFVGFCSLTVQAGIPPEQVVFMTGAVWALPAKVILVSSVLGGASLATAFLAVTLSSVRLMPMVAALIPELRTSKTPTWLLLVLSHFVAITAWVFAMERVQHVPRDHRVTFFAGFGITLVAANMLLVAIVYHLVAEFPPIVAGCLFFLTPVYFLTSIWHSARHPVVYVALATGLALGPLSYWIAPEFDILLAGVGGGTFAWLAERLWHSRREPRA
ncbi:AzlC family ABC transporter permease [Sinorhizobium numidicum]|uniref:AzlC family ABC transporter permease n=1 Tax=Sinorhizobium numidicum TaxID=680248 RepID=A0ABY8CUF4_9HYPH|nr:AzlC family ABC transporter permease [Sinorhizobium numidicum]WEX78812.1 AzlC family ABC transporter permease [Sinorhizobium numidicum]WEX82209.1 AzlC family ABC transporter permease [Sinorhizobium numidicum]